MRVPNVARRTCWLLLLLGGSAGAVQAAVEHNPLLPRPQTTQYGPGRLALAGVGISFGSVPSAEDRFAATELSQVLKEATGVNVPILEHPGKHAVILLVRTGPPDPLPMPGEQPGPKSREAYQLKVTPSGVEIRGRSSAAVFYGVETLRQLVEKDRDQAFLPEVTIEDWPSLSYRGPLWDVGSEGAMATEEEIMRQIDFLAKWKTNQYFFYSEANIELDGYPLLNPHARFTKDQVRHIIAYARDRHIDVVPCLEFYGHLHDLFRVEKYADLADFRHGGEFDPANPKVLPLLTDWVDQFAKLFPSPFVQIGFDETWQIEEAAQKKGAGATPATLFVEQLGRVARLFQERGKQVMAWADVMVKYPEIVTNLPPGIIAGVWHYLATPDPEYKRWLAPVVARSIPHVVQSGVHSWIEITPDFDTTFENIDTLLAAGRKSGALGLLNSVWTDSGQNLLRQSWPGVAYGVVAAWQSAPIDRSSYFLDYARQTASASDAPDVAQALADLSRAEATLQKVLGQATMQGMWNDPFDPVLLQKARAHSDDLIQTRLLAEGAEEHLAKVVSSGRDDAVVRSLLVGSRMLDYAGMKYLYASQLYDGWEAARQSKDTAGDFRSHVGWIYLPNHGLIDDLMDKVTGLREAYRRDWLAQYTSYRLPKALGRWDAEYEYWRSLQARFLAFAGEHKEGEPLPPIGSILKKHD
jgi:hexosaminidase